MKLVILTDYRENYGFATGGVRWKNKFGSEYILKNVERFTNDFTAAGIDPVIELVRGQIEWKNEASENTISTWMVLGDSEVTPDQELMEEDYTPRFVEPELEDSPADAKDFYQEQEASQAWLDYQIDRSMEDAFEDCGE